MVALPFPDDALLLTLGAAHEMQYTFCQKYGEFHLSQSQAIYESDLNSKTARIEEPAMSITGKEQKGMNQKNNE